MSRFFKSPAFILLTVSLLSIVLFTVGPLISLFTAGAIANAAACAVPLSSTAPCPIMGIDVGDTLTLMVFVGYLAFFTVPVGKTLLMIWAAVACIVTSVWWFQSRRGKA